MRFDHHAIVNSRRRTDPTTSAMYNEEYKGVLRSATLRHSQSALQQQTVKIDQFALLSRINETYANCGLSDASREQNRIERRCQTTQDSRAGKLLLRDTQNLSGLCHRNENIG